MLRFTFFSLFANSKKREESKLATADTANAITANNYNAVTLHVAFIFNNRTALRVQLAYKNVGYVFIRVPSKGLGRLSFRHDDGCSMYAGSKVDRSDTPTCCVLKNMFVRWCMQN